MAFLSYAPLQRLHDPDFDQAGITVRVLRLDLYPSGGDVMSSGNKYFKLKYNIQAAQQQGKTQLLSFGGAYSNHIHALALAGKQYGLQTIGLIRGEQQLPLNPTLQDAVDAGMQLHYLSRADYRRKTEVAYITDLARQFPEAFIIPEGGSNQLGVQGCMEIAEHLEHYRGQHTDTVMLPVATGATMAGLVAALPNSTVVGVAVLKGADFLRDELNTYLLQAGQRDRKNWLLECEYHGGGYARFDSRLAQFVSNVSARLEVPLEPVYSGKLFKALYEKLQKKAFPRGSNITLIHTGGMQGLRGMQQRFDAALSGISD